MNLLKEKGPGGAAGFLVGLFIIWYIGGLNAEAMIIVIVASTAVMVLVFAGFKIVFQSRNRVEKAESRADEKTEKTEAETSGDDKTKNDGPGEDKPDGGEEENTQSSAKD